MSHEPFHEPSFFSEEEAPTLITNDLSRQDRCLGAVLGAAIGDAMGHPTEFLSSVAEIRRRYGPAGVTKFELYWERDGKRFAPYTDATQMAAVAMRTLPDGHGALDTTMRRVDAGFR